MFSIDGKSRVPIYEQIKNQIMEFILIGIFKPNDKLPSIRALAQDAGLNVNTVKHAFLDLENSGVIYTLPGRGSFVDENALSNEVMQKKAMSEVYEVIASARAKGVSQEKVVEIVNDLYKQGGLK
ncbi:MAG: GntR family transcriptional regulator [Eubacteriales bacterium]